MSDVFAATKNAGKLRELLEIFAGTPLAVRPFEAYGDVTEGESSYAENAALKARALHAQLRAAGIRAAVLGDDSGLEIVALDGRPGVLSARYGGLNATWAERRQALLAELTASGSDDRRARFVCALHYIDEDGAETGVIADLAGVIAREERGSAGFSYDPIFARSECGATLAELPTEEKNRISHRARAARQLLTALGYAKMGGPETTSTSGKEPPPGCSSAW